MDLTERLRIDRDRIATVLTHSLVMSAMLCALAGSSTAFERDVALRFQPPVDSEVAGYLVYARDAETGVESVFDAGFVPPALDGVALTTVALEETRQHTVQMTAYNDSGESTRSNQILVAAVAPVCDARLCDDRNPCTADTCDALGCLNAPVRDGAVCDDGYMDTVDDQCVQGVCEGLLLSCRADYDCDDGNVCNGFESCGGTAGCLEGTPLYCGEPKECTAPRCDSSAGCVTDRQPDGTSCNDGNSETWDDVCLSGTCQGAWPDSAPDLAIESVSPEIVSPGRQTIEVYGSGFVPGAVLSFVNGKGRRPKVKSVRLVDDGLLVATIEVPRHKRRSRTAVFDVRVTLPDGREVFKFEALRVEP
jgi:hypothetical protein